MKIFTNYNGARRLGKKTKLMKGKTKANLVRAGVLSALIGMSAAGLLTGCGIKKDIENIQPGDATLTVLTDEDVATSEEEATVPESTQPTNEVEPPLMS